MKHDFARVLSELPKLSDYNGMPDPNSDDLFVKAFWQWYGANGAAIRRALEMASDPAFVRVPVEPTEAMYWAGRQAFQNPKNQHGAVINECFKAMIQVSSHESENNNFITQNND